ncbi:hypothetical protein ACIF83_35440 [Streptomyces sp. NPDC085866]
MFHTAGPGAVDTAIVFTVVLLVISWLLPHRQSMRHWRALIAGAAVCLAMLFAVLGLTTVSG